MQRTELPSSELLEPLVTAAHAIWCDCMQRAGWRLGAQYDADAKTDPNLRPLNELPAFERDHISDREQWRDVVDGACECVGFGLRYGRSELREEHVHAGTRVRLTPGDHETDGEEVLIGRVIEWESAPTHSGRLKSISVRWDDGDEIAYPPNELELAEA